MQEDYINLEAINKCWEESKNIMIQLDFPNRWDFSSCSGCCDRCTYNVSSTNQAEQYYFSIIPGCKSVCCDRVYSAKDICQNFDEFDLTTFKNLVLTTFPNVLWPSWDW